MGADHWRDFTLATPEEARAQKRRERVEKAASNQNKTQTRRRIEELEDAAKLAKEFEL